MGILTLDQMLAEELAAGKTQQVLESSSSTDELLARDEPPFPVFDLHCDTADRLAWSALPDHLKQATGLAFYGPGDETHPDQVRDLACNCCHISLERIGATPWIQCFAAFIPDELSPAQALEFWQHVQAYLQQQVAHNPGRCTFAQNSSTLAEQLSCTRVLAIPTVENARMLALDPSLASKLAQAGVRMASLSWNAAGPLASGHDTLEGLSTAGRQALDALVRAGIIIDVSHLNDTSFDDVARATSAPLVASHSNSRSICPAPRNLTDAQFCEIRERGGLVGINFYRAFLAEADAGLDDIARHIEHFLDLGGENTLALGSDYDGCDVPACVADASHMPSFQQSLVHFFGADITRKICAGNALRFFDQYRS